MFYALNARPPGKATSDMCQQETGGSSNTGATFGDAQTGHCEADIKHEKSFPYQRIQAFLGRKASGTQICGAETFSQARDLSRPIFCHNKVCLDVEDRVHLWLATLTCEFPPDFVAVNRVHYNDVIRTVIPQECRGHDSLPGARKKFADAVRIDVNHVLDLAVHSERR